jgi:hypothetical protein
VIESAAGTRGARTTHSLGNIRCPPGYRTYPTGASAVPCSTRLALLGIPRSAFRVPPSAGPAAYAASVTALVDGWIR